MEISSFPFSEDYTSLFQDSEPMTFSNSNKRPRKTQNYFFRSGRSVAEKCRNGRITASSRPYRRFSAVLPRSEYKNEMSWNFGTPGPVPVPERQFRPLSRRSGEPWEGQWQDLIDKCCEDMQLNATEVVEMMKIAAWCLQSDYANRPSMSTVIKVLGGVKDAQIDIDYNMLNLPSLITKIPQVGSQDVTPLPHSVPSGPR